VSSIETCGMVKPNDTLGPSLVCHYEKHGQESMHSWQERESPHHIHPSPKKETINHPAHYGGDTSHETIKCIEAWGLNYSLGNAVKYISRNGKKQGSIEGAIEDLQKAEWYIRHEIERLIDATSKQKAERSDGSSGPR